MGVAGKDARLGLADHLVQFDPRLRYVLCACALIDSSERLVGVGAIELATGERFPILYEDRSVLAIDKPRDWMLVPFSWQNTGRNLQAALISSIAAGDFWARSRGLKYLRFVHRLDAETTGVLLLAKSQGALHTYSELFESRKMEKVYLAAVQGVPKQEEWTCGLKLGPDPDERGKMKVDARHGKVAETWFRVLQTGEVRNYGDEVSHNVKQLQRNSRQRVPA